MPLNKEDLKTTISSILKEMLTKEENSIDQLAGKLSDAIETFVKSGTVMTQGSAVSQTGYIV